MIWHGLILKLFEINYWKLDENKEGKIWHLQCIDTSHILVPSVGVPSMPLLEKVK